MKVLPLLLVLATAASAQDERPRRCLDRRDRASRNCQDDRSLLRFLPSVSSAQECTGSALAGTRGEPLTFTRGSSATCTKSDGTLVTLTNDQPRVEGNGLLLEGPSTNVLGRSADIDNVAAWAPGGIGATSPVVSANTTDVAAPDGTFSAEKVVFPAVSGAGAVSQVSQGFTATAAAWSSGIYLRGTGAQTVYIWFRDNGATVWHSTACAINTTWSRCKVENKTLTAATWHFVIGIDKRDVAQATLAAQTVYVSGGQAEAGQHLSSYIATAGTTVTRATEPPPTFAASTVAGLSLTEGCTRVTWTPGFSGVHAAGQYLLSFRADSNFRTYINAGSQAFFAYDGVHIASESSTFTAGTSRTVHTTWSAALNRLKVTAGGSPTTTAFTTFSAPDQLQILNLTSTGAWPSFISDIVIANGAASCGGTP